MNETCIWSMVTNEEGTILHQMVMIVKVIRHMYTNSYIKHPPSGTNFRFFQFQNFIRSPAKIKIPEFEIWLALYHTLLGNLLF